MAARYEIVEYEFGCPSRTHMVCDGPEGPSLLTTLFSFFNITGMSSGLGDAPPSHLEKTNIEDRVLATMVAKSLLKKEQGNIEYLAVKDISKLVNDHLGPESYVTPILSSHVDFEESQELCVLDIFAHMEIPLLHCWMVDPEDLTICPNILSFSYEKLQKYIKVVENVSGALQASDVAAKRAVIQKLLEANKQLTSHGYATLCDLMEENALAVLYWDNKFYVVHRHDGSLLLLETNSGILKEYPEVRWRLFEEEDRDTIYLNDQYFPPNGQPNFERAMSWHQSKVSEKIGEPSNPEGSGPRLILSRGQRRRLRKRLAKDADAEALNKHDLGKGQQEASTEATSAVSDDQLGHTEGSSAEENRSQLSSDGNKDDQVTSSQVPTVVSSKPDFTENQQAAFNAAPPSSDDKLNQQDESNRHEASLEEPTESQPSESGTLSHTIAEDETKSTVGEDFLKFLLLFNDGTSRFKDGSHTERVPFFEGMVEAVRFTGSPIFYVPFKFIEMYDMSLAGTIQNSYPRISKDLTQSVCKYLAKHGVDIAAQLEILHLPEPSVQLFLDFIKDLDFLEEYDVYAFDLEHSPSYHSRKMALGYMHAIVDKFKEGRCFGGN